MLAILIGEMYKFYKRLFTKIIGLISLGVFLIAFWTDKNLTMNNNGIMSNPLLEKLTFPSVWFSGVDIGASFFSLLSLIMISTLVGQEYVWNTYKTISIRGTDKLDYINSKILTVLAYVVVLTLIGTGLFVGLAALNQNDILTKVQPNLLLEGYLFPVYFFVFIWSMLMYISIGFFASVTTKSSGIGILFLFIYFLVGMNLLGFILNYLGTKYGTWISDFANHLPGRQVDQMIDSKLLDNQSLSSYLSNITKPFLESGLYSVGFYVASLAVLKKRDILS